MVDGEDRSALRPLRPAAPLDGPLASSGAAPDEATGVVPRPRRPWLRTQAPPSGTPDATGADEPEASAPKVDQPDATADRPKADEPQTATAKADEPENVTTEADEPGAVGAAADPPKTGDTKAGEAPPAAGGSGTPSADAVAPAGPPAARRRRVPFAHAVRTPPGRVALTAARATRDWSRRPSGRLTVPGVFLLALVAATAAAGALLVPAAVRAPRPVAVDATAPTGLPDGAFPAGSPPPPATPLPSGSAPIGAPTVGVPTGGPVVGTGRPADALAAWAAQISPKVTIPAVALQAYGYAELVLSQTNRSCALSWTTLAAIGHVESGHGSANGARLGTNGKALPKIIGLPLDGQGGRMRIADTDRGLLDGDAALDRAIGPMQFIPTTWQEIGADADNDGIRDPHDIDDAALAAGNYLCKGGRNLTIPGDWWNAILSYNDVRRYAQDVYDTANRYGQASRT
ncbi:lytic murein transglycosylase [Micromonospora sp. BQ11]|uniref:lytic transglycosylase domain-containing protein n=1 Tax=Micromonospora sp. BQ11 TaxID=3452212 RepID=UPI003F8ADECD